MRKCELCDSLAKMYCESDQASLCWDCDAKVHSANFLVAKHSRTLLCHLCQSFTPWTAAGPRLSPTVSVCINCVNDSSCREERRSGHDRNGDNDDDRNGREGDGDGDGDGDDNEDEDDENGDEDDDDDDEENQVVPLSSTALPPAPVSSSSNSDQESCNSDEDSSLSRIVSSSASPVSQNRLCCSMSKGLDFLGINSISRLKNQKKGLQRAKIPQDSKRFANK